MTESPRPDRWNKVQEVFLQALERSAGERTAYLDEACSGDDALRREVESLLASEEAAGKSFIRPPGEGGFPAGDSIPSPTLLTSLRPAPGSVPDWVGPYRVIESIGEGGMGVVCLAEQTEPIRRRVAVKFIRAGWDTKQVLARFAAERQTLAMMQHPNIAVVHDAGETETGQPYFVMEHVAGAAPITDYSDQRRLTVRERIGLFLDLCAAVAHAHQKGVIHRDLKPSNVLVSAPDGKPLLKVIDFGISKTVDPLGQANTLLTAGGIIGTPGYMSPEQAEGGAEAVDTRTDIYSLGAILYELLVGTLPLDSATLSRGNFAEILRSIREVDPSTPSTRLARDVTGAVEVAGRRKADVRALERQLRGDLDWITMKALEKDPARRYASAAELAADLERYLRHEPVLARPPSIPYRLRKFARRHQWQVAAAAAVLFVAAGLAVANWGLRLRRSRDLIAQGTAAHQKFREERDEKEEWRRAWLRKKDEYKSWQPPWERPAEMEAWRRFTRLDEGLEDRYHDAVLAFNRATDEAPLFAPAGHEAKQALAAVYYDRFNESLAEGRIAVSPRFFRQSIERLGVEGYETALEGAVDISIESTPPGAEVHCFRYEEVEARLFPLPCAPGSGVAGEPFLRVARVREGHATFRPGDRLIAVERAGAGEAERKDPVRTLGDLARALAGMKAGEGVLVHVLRAGKEETLPWVPYPEEKLTEALTAGRVLDTLAQFDLLFEGYPLDFVPAGRLGVTGPLKVQARLGKGSYLLVLRKPGFQDARVPVVAPGGGENIRVRLIEEERIPPGFIYIPDGPVAYGDDPEAYLPLGRGTEEVAGFFLARTEVTFREYLEFINAPETLERLKDWSQEKPSVDPLIGWEEGELKRMRPQSGRVELIPREVANFFLEREEGAKGFRLSPRFGTSLDAPVVGIGPFAGLEYAHWLTGRHGGRWRFRLPTDFEWEKAARGVDRRRLVWGNYLLHSFMNSRFGSYRMAFERVNDIAEAGTYPLDESIYGIRDLAGCAKEPVLTPDPGKLPPPFGRFSTLRGGGWDDTDYRDFHAATRNRRPPERGYFVTGIRLAADVPGD